MIPSNTFQQQNLLFPSGSLNQIFQAAQPPPNPSNSFADISQMYSTPESMQPYYNNDFLCKTFNFNVEYIQAFLSLPHQEKLKMFLLMEQKKLYGDFGDKPAYQKILKDIANRIQNMHNFNEGANAKANQQKKYQNAINNICDDTFKKMYGQELDAEIHHAPHEQDFGEFQEVKRPQSAHQDEDFGQFQQIKATTQQNGSTQQKQSYITMQNEWNSSKNVADFEYIASKTDKFDSNAFGNAMYFEQSAKDPQKVDIWDLSLPDDFVKAPQPNIHQIFKPPQVQTHKFQQQENATDIVSPRLTAKTQSFEEHVQYNGFNQIYFQKDNQRQNYISEVQPEQIQQQKQENIHFQEEEEEWQQAQPIEEWTEGQHTQSIKEIQQIQQIKEIPNVSIQESKKAIDIYDIFDEITPNTQNPISTIEIDITQSDPFDFLQAKTTPISSQKDIPTPQLTQTQDFSKFITLDFNPIEQSQPSLSNSMLFAVPNTNQQKYGILSKVKINLSQKNKEYLQKMLIKKSFQCSVQFYSIIYDHLKLISMENSQDFQHIAQQLQNAKQIQQYSTMFSIVNEQQEQKLHQSIKKSKLLYMQIYNGSHQTENIVNKLLQNKSEFGLVYKIGKLMIDASISTDLIQKCIHLQKPESIISSLACLYVLQKANSINKIRSISQSIISFVLQEYQKYRSLDSDKFNEFQVRCPDKFQIYTKGLLKLSRLCMRAMTLLKVSTVKPNCNFMKTVKICKQIVSKFGQGQSEDPTYLDDDYVNPIKIGTLKNCSIYDFHTIYMNLFKQAPICRVCFFCSKGNDGGQIGEEWFHFGCYNLIKQIQAKQCQEYQ